ncbi:MAG: DUF5320 domain-containing protein [Bacillota bacterium]
MPGRNMTGPLGQGPMTGRGQGLCNSSQLGYNNRKQSLSLGFRKGMGRGLGRGRGLGLGMGLGYAVQDDMTLKQEREILQTRINEIDKEINKE